MSPSPFDSQADSPQLGIKTQVQCLILEGLHGLPLSFERLSGFLSFLETQRKESRKRWEDSDTNGFSIDFHSLIFYTVERLVLK